MDLDEREAARPAVQAFVRALVTIIVSVDRVYIVCARILAQMQFWSLQLFNRNLTL